MKITRHTGRPFRVQILCETANDYYRNIRLGLRHHGARTGGIEVVGSWRGDALYNPASGSARRMARGLLKRIRDDIRGNRVDGVVAEIKHREMAETLAGLGIPVVEVADFLGEAPFPVVTQDWGAVGRLAAGHLAELGGAAFGFWGIGGVRYSGRLKEAFTAALAERRADAQVFAEEGRSILDESGARLIRRMEKWLGTLPTPAGVFALAEPFGQHLLEAAGNIGLRVPEDIALLVGGNDAYWVDYGTVPLSGIQYNAAGVAAAAAELVERMIKRGTRKARGVEVGGSELFARHSTDTLFVKDAAIAKAVAHIRANAGRNLYAGEIARAAGISRSGLHQRFKAALGHGVLTEVRNARIRHAQVLLRTTGLSLAEVAEACDFQHTPALHLLFKKVTGKTPAKYRKGFLLSSGRV